VGTGNANPGRQALAYAAFGIVYFLLAQYAASLPFQSRLPLFVWPAHGIALGTLLVAPMRRWPVYLALVLLASLAVGAQLTEPWTRIAVMLAVNVILPFFVALGLIRLAGPEVKIDSVRSTAAFLVGMAPLLATTAVVEGLFSGVRFDTPLRDQWSVTVLSDMVGMLALAPVVLAWSRGELREWLGIARTRLPELFVLYGGLILTAHYVFVSRPDVAGIIPPLAYLCAPFLIWAALRFGLREATLGLAIFGMVTYWQTSRALGPVSLEGNVLLLLHVQAYLAVILVTTLFAASLLNERQDAAEETEAWRKRHETVIRASGNLLYELNPATGSILWDGDTQAVLGLAPGQISTLRQWMGRVHPDDRMRLKGLRQLFTSGELPHVSLEYRFRGAGEEYTTLGVNGYLVDDPGAPDGPRRVIGFVKDVSEKIRADEDRQRLEAQLKQAEKMEAVGHLAGGIAHDFNNILGAILGYGELAQKRAEGDLRRYLDTIMSAGNRAKALVTQILSYSRAENSAKIPVIVVPVAQEACDLIRGSSPSAIEVVFNAPNEDIAVLGDPTRLHQLFMNLFTNAIQAMGRGGRLEVEVSTDELASPRKVRTGEIAPGEYVRIVVSDTGHGIAPEVIDRIFEPFFTTKPAGQGTGLGLALVHAVVKEHEGYIDVTSELGRGTQFTIWIPRTAAERGAAAPVELEPQGRGQVILAVDDEPEVLAALEEMLATLGYEPAGFNNSHAALEAVREDPRRFDAVVTDEVMPWLTGTQLAIEMRKVNPSLPIVIASGYGGAGFETRALSAGVNRVLRKPYRMAEIGEVLATVLRQ
jgi:signal transduction histidine kinase/ActR/RegA family two-component response regulator